MFVARPPLTLLIPFSHSAFPFACARTRWEQLGLTRWRRTKCFRNTEFNGYSMQLSGEKKKKSQHQLDSAESHDVNRLAARRTLLGESFRGMRRGVRCLNQPSAWAAVLRPLGCTGGGGPGAQPEEGRRCLGVETPSPCPCVRAGLRWRGPGSASSPGSPQTLLSSPFSHFL